MTGDIYIYSLGSNR